MKLLQDKVFCVRFLHRKVVYLTSSSKGRSPLIKSDLGSIERDLFLVFQALKGKKSRKYVFRIAQYQ